jgi:transcriptional regulator GlxA family with amidase domain
VRSVLNVVLRELEKPQSVQRIAAQVGLSPSWFEHIFKKETGHTFKVFLRTTRLAKAKDMLRDSALRVKEVAAAVGYADASDFAHDFRRQYGQSPSQLRKPPGPPLGVGGRVVRASPKPPTPNSRFHQQKAGSTNKQQISPTDYR